jgi:hypothetical protein
MDLHRPENRDLLPSLYLQAAVLRRGSRRKKKGIHVAATHVGMTENAGGPGDGLGESNQRM